MINNTIIEKVNELIKKLNIKNYTGIIVYGSYVGERNNSLSDLDVMIIKENYHTLDCGSMMIDNVRVEFFINDLQRLYSLADNEINNNDPSHLTKFATCEIISDTNDKVKDFVNYAKYLYNQKIQCFFTEEDKFSIFSINNRIEDLESLINQDSFYAVYFIVLEKIRVLYSKINGIIDLPLMKIERIYIDKEYANNYINSSIHTLPNETFISLYLNCLNINDKNEVDVENKTNIKNDNKTNVYRSTYSDNRCQATTKKGERCKRNAEPGSKYCWQHNK